MKLLDFCMQNNVIVEVTEVIGDCKLYSHSACLEDKDRVAALYMEDGSEPTRHNHEICLATGYSKDQALQNLVDKIKGRSVWFNNKVQVKIPQELTP